MGKGKDNEEEVLTGGGGGVYNTKVPGKISEKPNFYSVQTAVVPVAAWVATGNPSFTTDEKGVYPKTIEILSTAMRRGNVTQMNRSLINGLLD
jgi:hypothetical protein